MENCKKKEKGDAKFIDIPLVKRKSGDQQFNIENIVKSLAEETNLDEKTSKEIAIDVARFIVSKNLKIVTAPLIREIVNVQLLSRGLEKERLMYTRIGFPFADLTKIVDKMYPDDSCFRTIFNGVITEYRAVKKLIEER